MNAITNTALMPITTRPDAVMVRGSGSYLWDNSERRYLDFIQGWAVNALGHCPVQITDALQAQATQLISPSPALHNAPQHTLATKLCQLSGMHQVHFANSGAEANEAAVKLARKWGKLNKPAACEIITTENGFHGRTLAMMAASGKPGWDTLFPPAIAGFPKVPFGDIDATRAAINDNTLAIMLEPIQGEAGVIMPPAGYLSALRKLADEFNCLLILDEVQTGIGRMGCYFAYLEESIQPDIVTLGKGLGGGVPISAVLAAQNVCVFEPGDQGGTYNGNPLMCAAAQAVVETVCTADFMCSVNTMSARLTQGLQALAKQHQLTEVRGKGLLLAVELKTPVAAKVQTAAFDLGLLINAPRPSSLRLMPALNVNEVEIDEALQLLDEALART